MNIKILCVGRIKEKYFNDAIKEYEKRLSRYCSLQIIEVADEKVPENLSYADMQKVKKNEGESILKKINNGEYVIALDIKGKKISSEVFAKKISDFAIYGKSKITFIIGGSIGLSDEVLRRSDMLLSFSEMTFTHQMIRVILLEQIYRAYKINNNEPYHK